MRTTRTGRRDLPHAEHLLGDLGDVLVPQLNPEHVVLVEQGLLLGAIFRLVPGHDIPR